MNLLDLTRLIRRTGRIAEPAPPAPAAERIGSSRSVVQITQGGNAEPRSGQASPQKLGGISQEPDLTHPDLNDAPHSPEVTARLPGIASPAPGRAPRESEEFAPPPQLRGSVQVRQVDCGSCNGCEIEIAAAFGPVYDAERYGARLVPSPRHADVLLVTGAVTHNMAEPLRRTLEATPKPRVVIAVGDCALDRGAFTDGYGVAGSVAEIVDVDLGVPGCPPEPDQIVAALRRVTQR